MKTPKYPVSKLFLFLLIWIWPLQAGAQSPGFFLDDWQPRDAVIPQHQETEKPVTEASVSITLDGAQMGNKVPVYVFGNNAVSWDNGLPKNSTAMTDLKNLNPHVLRWPGGSLSDVYFWNVPYGERPADIPSDISPWYGANTQSWQMSTDEYYTLLSQTNSVGMITVNYGYARYGTSSNPVTKAAHMAAEWVRYDNGRSKYWEIGNEDFGSWEAGYRIDPALNQDGQPEYISGQLYGQHCRVFLDSMRFAAAQMGVDIRIGVVAFDAETSWDPIQTTWNEEMMAEVGDLADFISVHSYYTPYNENSSYSTVLNSHTAAGEIKAQIESDMAGAGKTMLPLAMTEWNIFAVGSMQAVSFINGMHAALVLGEYIKEGYGQSSRWDLVNGWDNGNDHAMFSSGGEPGVDAYNPRPAFFYMYYFQHYFGDQMIASSVSGNNSVVSYASVFSSGETGVVLINKSKVAETVKIDPQNLDTGPWYYYHVLTGGTDNGDFSRKVLINGIETDEEGGGPDEYASIVARSAETDGGITVALPPLGVVYLMIGKKPPLSYVSSRIETDPQMISVKLSEEVSFPENPAGFSVMLNESTSLTINHIEADQTDPRIMNIFLDEVVLSTDKLTVTYSGTSVISSGGDPLLPFTNEAVKNLLPGAPVQITIQILNSANRERLEGCAVILNGETKTSDINGEASFTAPQGDMQLNVSKTYFEPIVNRDLYITKDSVVSILLDSASFNVTLMITDADRDYPVAGVLVQSGTSSLTSDAEGKVTFSCHAGSFAVHLTKVNYEVLDLQFTIADDVQLDIPYQRLAANVKFITREEGSLLYGVNITLGENSQVTNTVGMCIFSSVPVKNSISYTAEKRNYSTLNGELLLTKDSTVTLDLDRLAADLTFIIDNYPGGEGTATVSIGNQTAGFSDAGIAVVEGLAVGQYQDYLIHCANFADYSGSVYLTKDEAVHVSLEPTGTAYPASSGKSLIYPNPSTGRITVENEETIDLIRIIDLTGKFVFTFRPQGERKVLFDPDLEPGLYFITITHNGETETGKLLFK